VYGEVLPHREDGYSTYAKWTVEGALWRIMKGWVFSRDFIVNWFAKNNRHTFMQKYNFEVPKKLFGGPLHLNVKEIPMFVDKELEYYDQLRFGMIMGDQCELIVRTAKFWLPELKKAIEENFPINKDIIYDGISKYPKITDDEILLWKYFEIVWELVCADTITVEKWSGEKNDFSVPGHNYLYLDNNG